MHMTPILQVAKTVVSIQHLFLHDLLIHIHLAILSQHHIQPIGSMQ